MPGALAPLVGEVAARLPWRWPDAWRGRSSAPMAIPARRSTCWRTAFSAGLLTGVKARLLLTLALAAGADRAALAQALAAYE